MKIGRLRLNLTSIIFSISICLTGTGIYGAKEPSEPTAQKRADIIQIDSMKAFGKLERPPVPHGKKRAIAFKRAIRLRNQRHTADGIDIALQKAHDIPDGYLLGGSNQIIPAVKAAFGIYQPAAFELIEYDFQEFFGDGLCLGNFRNFLGTLTIMFGKFEYGPQGILILFGDQHLAAFSTTAIGKFVDY